MATTLYFRSATWGAGNEHAKWQLGDNPTNLAGVATAWSVTRASTTRGTVATSNVRTVTAGPTAGQEIGSVTSFISAPLAADVTISGSITFNIRMSESTAAVNAGAQCIIERINSVGAVASTLINSESGVELSAVGERAETWSASPTSTVFHKGDRIRIRVAANDAGGTLAAGQVTMWYDGPTAAATGDSYVTFTETLSLVSTFPTPGTTIYMTDTASDVDPNGAGYTPKRAWTSRGGGTDTAIADTTTGYTAPLLWTVTPGADFIEWFTPTLEAFTLGDVVYLNVRGLESDALANVSPRAEIAICDSGGTLVSVWGAVTENSELGIASAAEIWNVTGDDTAVTQGQRLRIRFYLDDRPGAAMATGYTATLGYDGTGVGTGDTYVIFGETLVEFTGSTTVVLTSPSETDTVIALTGVGESYAIAQVTEIDEAQSLNVSGVVQGLVATAISSTQIDLAWEDFDGATAYDIERNGVVIAEFQVGAEYFDSGLTASTTYTYRVRAVI